MTDRVMPAGEDENFANYVWDCGWLVSFNKFTQEWTKQRIPHPNDIGATAMEPNREAAPDVGGDDD